MKIQHFLLCLIPLAHVVLSAPSEDVSYSFEDDYTEDIDDEDVELARSWWSTILGQSLEILKKSIHLNPLNCNGPSCSTCISASIPKLLNKQGCFTITYNGQNGAKGNLNFNLNLDGKHVWGANVSAGKSVPSCASLPSPINQVCLQDFNLNASQNGQGNLCFVVSFKNYGFGARYCANLSGGRLHGANLPTLVKT